MLDATPEEVKTAQLADKEIRALRRIIATQSKEVLGPRLAAFHHKRAHLSFDDRGLLNLRKPGGQLVPVVPAGSVRTLAKELHDTVSHAKSSKVQGLFDKRFYHPRVGHVISEVVHNCGTCLQRRINCQKNVRC